MRMLIADYNVEIELVQGRPLCLCIEVPTMLRSILTDLWVQTNGGSGNIIFSREGKELVLAKNAELILNPFGVSFNDRKLVSKLYQEIDRIAMEENIDEIENLNSHIISYLDLITGKLPYNIDFELDLDTIALLKMYKVRFEEDYNEEFISKLASYIKLVHKVCGIEFFATYNIKQLLMRDEIEALFKELIYEQIFLLNIEGTYNYKLQDEDCIIVDKDECLILLD